MNSIIPQRMAAWLGVVLLGFLGMPRVQCEVVEEVIFQDSLNHEGTAGGVLLEDISPTVGEAYSGQGTLFSKEDPTGEKGDVVSAFGGRPFVKPENARFESLAWNISQWSHEMTMAKVVTVSFEFYMKNRGGASKGMIGIISFSDSGSGGRGWDVSLTEDGTVSWWDGNEFHETEVQFETDKVVSFKMVVDFPNRSYVATIGDQSFSGNLVRDCRGVRKIMFYNSTGAEFYYTEPKVTVAPET